MDRTVLERWEMREGERHVARGWNRTAVGLKPLYMVPIWVPAPTEQYAAQSVFYLHIQITEAEKALGGELNGL